MNTASIAPCGVICDICLGFQRSKNTCIGCKSEGNKPYHCTACSIKLCSEKEGKENALCFKCRKFPCRRIKNLDKRYTTKYGESPIENLQTIKDIGFKEFVKREKEKWKCVACGKLLCVHRDACIYCGAKNHCFREKM